MKSGLPDLCCSRSILVARVLSTRFSSKRCPMPGRRTGNCESLWNIFPVGEKFYDSFQDVSHSGKPRDSAGSFLIS